MQGIYLIRHIETDRCYVGSSVNVSRRWKEHLMRLRNGTHPAKHLSNAFKVYGEQAFEFTILEQCPMGDENIRIERENYWIARLKPVFNQAPVAGSVLGLKRTSETKARMGDAQRTRYAENGSPLKGRQRPEEACLAIAAGKKGKTFSAEHIANLKTALKGRTSPRKGVVLSDETKARISQSKKGIKSKPEHVTKRALGIKLAHARRKALALAQASE
jgi:group I intron endonuclease